MPSSPSPSRCVSSRMMYAFSPTYFRKLFVSIFIPSGCSNAAIIAFLSLLRFKNVPVPPLWDFMQNVLDFTCYQRYCRTPNYDTSHSLSRTQFLDHTLRLFPLHSHFIHFDSYPDTPHHTIHSLSTRICFLLHVVSHIPAANHCAVQYLWLFLYSVDSPLSYCRYLCSPAVHVFYDCNSAHAMHNPLMWLACRPSGSFLIKSTIEKSTVRPWFAVLAWNIPS